MLGFFEKLISKIIFRHNYEIYDTEIIHKMFELPEEIWIYIFSFLTIRTIVFNVPLVCKTWKNISRDIHLGKTFIEPSYKRELVHSNWTLYFLPELNEMCKIVLRKTFFDTGIEDKQQFIHDAELCKNHNLYICCSGRYGSKNHIVGYPHSALQSLIQQCHPVPTFALITVVKNNTRGGMVQSTIIYEFAFLKQMILEMSTVNPLHILNRWPFRLSLFERIHCISMIGLVEKTGHLSLDTFLHYLSLYHVKK